jgi:hypothetical protein
VGGRELAAVERLQAQTPASSLFKAGLLPISTSTVRERHLTPGPARSGSIGTLGFVQAIGRC